MEAKHALYIKDDVVKFNSDNEDFVFTPQQFDILLRIYNGINKSMGATAAFIDEDDKVHFLYLKEK